MLAYLSFFFLLYLYTHTQRIKYEIVCVKAKRENKGGKEERSGGG